LEFDGPKNFHVFGNIYTSITTDRETGYSDAQNAREALDWLVQEFIKGADQIAWRVRPEVWMDDKMRWFGYARLAVWPDKDHGKSA
jgi:hypothetical protein